MYESGEGVRVSNNEFIKWLRKAAEDNCASAQFYLGDGYGSGWIESDPKKAIYWMKRSIENGCEEGFQCGMYETDPEIECLWYEIGTIKGSGSAPLNLQDMYAEYPEIQPRVQKKVTDYLIKRVNGSDDPIPNIGLKLTLDEAQYGLGIAYRDGKGVEQSDDKAQEYLKQSIENGNQTAILDYAITLFKQGTNDSYKESYKWFNKAAQNNNEIAEFYLGLICESGFGAPQSYEDAAKHYARSNIPYARLRLGMMYIEGRGVPQSFNEGLHMIKELADGADPAAQLYLGDMYRDGIGVEQSYKDALHYYTQCEHWTHSPDAQYRIGMMYYEGLGVRKSYNDALMMFNNAASQNYADAEFKLGEMYAEGKGVKKSESESNNWYHRAADDGNVDAQIMLGYGLMNSQNPDHAGARYWFEKAASQGNAAGNVGCGIIYQYGLGVEQSDKTAYEYYSKAAEMGDAEGQFRLAEMYRHGWGVIQSLDMARAWYNKSAIQGNSDAAQALREIGSS